MRVHMLQNVQIALNFLKYQRVRNCVFSRIISCLLQIFQIFLDAKLSICTPHNRCLEHRQKGTHFVVFFFQCPNLATLFRQLLFWLFPLPFIQRPPLYFCRALTAWCLDWSRRICQNDLFLVFNFFVLGFFLLTLKISYSLIIFLNIYSQIKLVNIRPEDIVDGNPKLTLGLIWTIILHYQVSLCEVD